MKYLKKLKKSLGFILVSAFILSMFIIPQTANADLCGELSKSTGGFFSCSDAGETTFTQFQGGLKAPSTEGYDPSLVQQTNLRDYVVNIVNFVLGFLGLVAVIIVIYGGFVYVTAAGSEEKTGKGKKSIMYAMIGIVIILISYALVNTVIKGVGKGTDKADTTIEDTTTLQGAAGTGLTGDQTKAIQRLFYVAATKVEKAAKDIAIGYQHYVDTYDLLTKLSNIPPVSSAQQLSVYFNDVNRALDNLISTSGQLSRTAQAAKNAQNYIDEFLQKSQAQLEDEWTTWYGADKSAELQKSIENYFTQAGGEYESMWTANEMDFTSTIQKVIDDLEELKNDVESSGLVTTAETEFGTVYERAKTALETLKPTAFNPATNAVVVDALEALSEFHTVVLNIKFVAAIIATDVDAGNAPLIVNMDALNSMRPDYQSIKEEEIIWDFGDGNKAEGKFATSHVYKKTGTYIITLSVKGDSLKNIASGKAYQEIKVNPPASQINLKVSIGDRDLGYLSYYQDGYLVIDKNRLNVTLTEARDQGIIFDASESRGGFQSEQDQPAGETYIQTIQWSFGDGSDRVMGEMVAEDVQTHYYGDPGTYSVVLEITDSRGVKDRKIFEVVVDSPAARIDVSPSTKTKINQDVVFDAGRSTTDGGQITGYSWEIHNAATDYSATENLTSFTKKFENPGVYNVTLKVTDNLDVQATDKIDLTVESEAPKAQFTYSVPDATKPHIYMLDGTQSFDPDGNIQTGNYIYKWTLSGVSRDYQFVDEKGVKDEAGATKSRTYIKFFRTGDYKVTLEVNDKNEPENPGKPAAQDLKVVSILDVAFGPTSAGGYMLNSDSEALVTLSGISENGIAYEWDFGDKTEIISGDVIGGKIQTQHTYTAAGTYDVRLTVFDRENNENSIKRRVVVGAADSPLAVITLKVNGNEIYDFSEPVEMNRKDVISVSAEKALNRDGTGRRLGYQWDFGDTQRSTQRDATHTYSDLSPAKPGYFTLTLKVLDKNDLTKTSSAKVQIAVVGQLPTLQAFTAVPQGDSLTTPVKIKLDAIGAKDPDGRIVKYLWWYYDVRDPEMTMGHTITQTPQAFVNIGTRGQEGEEINYKFNVEMTDQENYSVKASDVLEENIMPALTVINGPNDLPVAKFTVDRTSIMLGDVVNFSSSSTDPDGQIVQYIWDFEGDGFADNKPTNLSAVSHVYEKPAVNGVNVRLKVIDNNFAEAISSPVKIFVDTEAKAPVAAFKYESLLNNEVKFINNSAADTEAGVEVVSYNWDFDLSFDSNGDSIKDNDVDSKDESPTNTYEKSGVYRAKLTVEDNLGNKTSVINFVYAKNGETTGTTGTGTLGTKETSGTGTTGTTETVETGTTGTTETNGIGGTPSDMEANVLGAINQNQIPAMVVSLVLFAIVTISLYLHTVRIEKLEVELSMPGRRAGKKSAKSKSKK